MENKLYRILVATHWLDRISPSWLAGRFFRAKSHPPLLMAEIRQQLIHMKPKKQKILHINFRAGFLRTVSLARWAFCIDSLHYMSEFACHDHDFIVDIEFLSIFQFLIFKWVLNPKIGVENPPNHPFVHRVWNHYFHHPFWGFSPIFGSTPKSIWEQISTTSMVRLQGSPFFLSLGLVRASRAFRGSQVKRRPFGRSLCPGRPKCPTVPEDFTGAARFFSKAPRIPKTPAEKGMTGPPKYT